jgi:hypothetical protein
MGRTFESTPYTTLLLSRGSSRELRADERDKWGNGP